MISLFGWSSRVDGAMFMRKLDLFRSDIIAKAVAQGLALDLSNVSLLQFWIMFFVQVWAVLLMLLQVFLQQQDL